LSKKLEHLPKFKPKQLTFGPELKPLPISDDDAVEEKSIRAIMDKGGSAIGTLPRKYLPFPDNKFGIWYDDENFYIGNKSNQILIEDNDLFVNDKKI
jgi:hypothetical protein